MAHSEPLYVREAPLAWRCIGDEAIVVNCGTNTLTRLNPAATVLFTALAEPASRPALARVLAGTFELPVDDELLQDVHDGIAELCELRLVRPVGQPPLSPGRLVADAWRDELDAIGIDLVAPTWAKIEVSTRCHLDCVHCYIPGAERNPRRFLPMAEQQPEMTDAEIRDTIDQLADLGTLLLTFTGGEIFMRRGMMDLIRHAHDRGFVIELFTSATSLPAAKIAELAALRIGRIQVSVYSHDAATHDGVTQVPGSWRRSTQSVLEMTQRGLHVDLACSLMQGNYSHALATAELAASLGATCSYGYPITARTDGNHDTHDLRLPPDALDEAITTLPAFFALPPAKSPDERICPAGLNMCSISSTGDMMPCSQFHMALGNIRQRKLRDLWESSPKLEHLRRLRMRDLVPTDPSVGSEYVGLCPGLNLLERGDFLHPAPITVETTRAVRRILASPDTPASIREALTSGGGMRPESA